jgi:hypothetical protein
MALVSMATFGTKENDRVPITRRCLQSMAESQKWDNHSLYIVDNGSIDEMKQLLGDARNWLPFTLITNSENRGTARAANQGWMNRVPGQSCLKCDDDIVYHRKNWLDVLEEMVQREPKIGIVSCKRRDLAESPHYPQGHPYLSHLISLPHQPGQRWLHVERVNHCIGSSQLYSSAFLDKIGYLYQMGGLYGFDDSLAAVRCEVAGMMSVFACGIDIEHVDPGGTPHHTSMQEYAGVMLDKFNATAREYMSGARSIYHGPFDE